MTNSYTSFLLTDPVPDPSIDPEVVNCPRKRKGPENWAQNKRKLLREAGEEYFSFGKKRSAKAMGPRCGCTDKGVDCSNVTDEDRDEIFRYIWSLTWEGKRAFVQGLVEKEEVKRRRPTASGNQSVRLHTLKYSLKSGSSRKRVCKTMFINTTALTQWFVSRTMSATESTAESKPISNPHYLRRQEDKEFLQKEFLDKLPRQPSHYCRQSTTKVFLQSDFKTMNEVYKLYVEKCEDQGMNPLSMKPFAKIFNENNLSIFKPKKDQCDVCVGFETGNVDREVWEAHQQLKIEARVEKEKEKIAAIESEKKGRGDVKVLCLDLQGVLLSPRLQASALYYKTKLAVHNFTIYDMATRDTCCYIWHEGNGKLTANEFASCIFHYLEEKTRGYSRVVIFSDGCCYQNRNAILANALSYAAIKLGIVIEQKILTKGHTQMEVDSVHSVIERALTRVSISVPMDYVKIIETARKTPKPYEVVYLDHTFFRDFSQVRGFKSIRPGRKPGDATVTNIRALQYLVNGNINYKLKFSDSWEEVPRPRTFVSDIQQPNQLYNEKLKIPSTKYKHLQELKSVLNKDHHSFYDNLLH